jgi:uncharacterized protein (DUF885 family)
MNRLSARLAAALTAISILISTGSNPAYAQPPAAVNRLFDRALNSYIKEFLRRNPAVSTYRGGAGVDASLGEADGRLRDHSAAAISAEDRWLASSLASLLRFRPALLSLSQQIDRKVAIAQIRFQLHLHQVRRYQQRALDTYTDEPFKAVDWHLQSMTPTGERTLGTKEEWALLIRRLEAIPGYFLVARAQLEAGVRSGNTPDWRMLRRNGIDTTEADANYFEKTLPELARDRVAGEGKAQLIDRVAEASAGAARAYREFRDFIARTFFSDLAASGEHAVKPRFRGDRFVLGEREYDWALRNNLLIDTPAAKLYTESWPIVEQTRNEMIGLAREIARTHGWSVPVSGEGAVRAVFDQLSKDAPKTDSEMIAWYREAAFKLVDYARRTGLFDVPANYQLEVIETPPPLRSSIDGAAYGPAPPLKNTGVGRFYVTPTGNDAAALKAHNRAALADLAAHEGFPGHDWHYKTMTVHRDEISPLRWLTPGGAEDSSSMWQDALAAEGWALYAEALMAEPQQGSPSGFYSPEERLYQLKGKLFRDLRVRIDIGIHTRRMSYDEAVDLFSEIVDFLPGSCRDASATRDPVKRASCGSAERAIFRYSKWPTQAITYRLGKEAIFALRDEAHRKAGEAFSRKGFHLLVMKQGRIPPGYYRELLLTRIMLGNHGSGD